MLYVFDGMLHVYTLDSRAVTDVAPAITSALTIHQSPDRQTVWVGTRPAATFRLFRVSLPDGAATDVGPLEGYDDDAVHVDFAVSDDGRYVADGRELYDLTSHSTSQLTLPTPPLSFSPDGTRVFLWTTSQPLCFGTSGCQQPFD